MDQPLVDQIRQRFPHLLGTDAEFRFGNGWFILLWMLLQKIEANHWPVLLGECHEKWGWMHIRLSTDMQNNPLEVADDFYTEVFITEYKSYYVCEYCSNPGVVRWDYSHIKVLCDACESTHDGERTDRGKAEDTWPGEWRVRRAAGYIKNI